MAKIVTNSIRRTYKRLIKQVILDLGETVTIYGAPEKADCPNCHYDPVTGKSKGIFDSSFVSPVVIFDNTVNPTSFNRGRCPICKGDGLLASYTPSRIRALVKWNPQDGEFVNTAAGIEGSNIVRIKSRSSNYTKVRDADYFVVDGVKCKLTSPPTFRGLGQQDEIVVAFLTTIEAGYSVKE